MSKKDLGPLTNLVGTWTNVSGAIGFNLIAVPVKDPTSFQLLTHQYIETITFKEITANVPNRGGINQQNITGLTYDLVITKFGEDPNDPKNILHAENGMLLYQADIEAQPTDILTETTDGTITQTTPFPIARQASIPHGDVFLALGAEVAVGHVGIPDFPQLIINPVGNPKPPAFVGYGENYPSFTGFGSQTDINLPLKQYIQKHNQNIGKVTTFVLDTANQGGITNIPFVQQNVVPSRFQATFWIEEVLNAQGGLESYQLQYSQVTGLNFDAKNGETGLVLWPHGNCNTLMKVSTLTEQRSIDSHGHHLLSSHHH